MAKTGKRHLANKEGINPESALDLKEAVALIKNKANSKFDETIEVALNLILTLHNQTKLFVV